MEHTHQTQPNKKLIPQITKPPDIKTIRFDSSPEVQSVFLN